jgi:HD-like signal output (HDOD) protein
MATPSIPQPTSFPLENLKAVIAKIDDQNSSIAQVADEIEQDPVLVAIVLRHSNMAAFAGRERVRSVKAAVLRLGKANVRRFLLEASARMRAAQVA